MMPWQAATALHHSASLLAFCRTDPKNHAVVREHAQGLARRFEVTAEWAAAAAKDTPISSNVSSAREMLRVSEKL